MKLDRFINRPVLSTVISIFIVLLGLIGLVTLPITQFPDIAPPTISVSADYYGANAQTVLNSVVVPLEEAINGAEGMTYMESTASNTGNATISVYFDQDRDPDMAAVDVQNRVSKALNLLPSEVTKIGVTTQKRQSSTLVGIALVDTTHTYSEEFIENYMKINVVPQLQRVPGVGDVMVMAGDYSMRIWLKPEVMAQYHLMPSDIAGVMAEQNIEAAPGGFGEESDYTFQYTMTYKGRMSTPEEFGDIVVMAKPDGEVLKLKDVADIELGRSTYAFHSTLNANPSCMAIVFQTAGSNATEIINNCLAYVDKAKADLPPGLSFEIPMNNNLYLYASIEEVIRTLIEAFILVFIVVYVFLQDMRSTIIPAIAIPVALVGTFFVMKLIGFSINLITLSALVLAIAIVVDDAIVVVEAVHAKLDVGYKSARRASIDAMSEISGAIVSITLVMMLVFIPVSFMSGTTGIFYRQFGLTMAIAIGFSAINALTLSPALCAVFLKPHDPDAKKRRNFVKRFHEAFNVGYDHLVDKYKHVTHFFIRFKTIAFGAVAVSIGILVWLMAVTPSDLVPAEDNGQVFVMVNTPPGTSQARTTAILSHVEQELMKMPGVKRSAVIDGYSFVAGRGPTYGTIIVQLNDWAERDESQSVDNVIKRIYGVAAGINDATVVAFAPPMIMGYSITNGFEVKMQDKTGGDINQFFAVVQGFLAQLNQQPEIQMAYTTFNPTFPLYMVNVDVAAAKKAGISPQTILSTLQGYYGSMYISNFNRFGKIYRVMMQAGKDSRVSPETLSLIKIRNGQEMAPISNFVSLERVYSPDLLNRYNMYSSISVSGTPADGYSNGDAIAAIQRVASETLPAGYGYEFSGMTKETAEQSGSSTAVIFGLCLLFVYLLLSAQYESYMLPWAVILSIPFGLMGTFIFADIWGSSNNIYLQIALIMLIGLLAKNAILIVEFARQRRESGMSITNAAIAGAAARLRPILMTSLALIIGLLPMAFASGIGANGNRALGAGAVGGMLIGMVLQVLFVPALYCAFQWLQEKISPLKLDDQKHQSDIANELEQYNANIPSQPQK